MTDYVALKDFALDLAPELRQSPLYVIPHPPELPAPSFTAYASPTSNATLQAHLKATGLWKGPGPVVAYVATGLSREESIAVLVHEVAHLLPRTPSLEHRETPELLAEQLQAFTSWTQEQEPEDKPRWHYGNHGENFVRIAIHLWWRAALQAVFVPLEALNVAGLRYDLSSAGWYWRCLGNEPVKMKDKTFAEILATPPPPAFRGLFDADLKVWMESHPSEVQKAINQ